MLLLSFFVLFFGLSPVISNLFSWFRIIIIRYGQQRLYAAISCGMTYAFSGFVVSKVGSALGAFVSHSFWTVVHVIVLSVIACIRAHDKKMKLKKNLTVISGFTRRAKMVTWTE